MISWALSRELGELCGWTLFAPRGGTHPLRGCRDCQAGEKTREGAFD